jgi:PEP-CTERM motif
MMKGRSLKISMVFCAAMIMMLPIAAKATTLGTVDIQHIGFGANEYIPIATDMGCGYINAGVVAFNKTGGTLEGNFWPNGTITGFCIEPEQPYPSWPVQYDVVAPQDGPQPINSMGLTKAKYLEELWGRYYDPAWTSGANAHQAAAFAVAIWEIVKEDLPASPLGWNVTSGKFRTSDGFSLANDWLHSLDGSGPKADLRAFVSGNYQDYIAAVPEPATLALLGIGALTGLLRRKRNCL